MAKEDNEQQYGDLLFNLKDLLEMFSVPSGAIRRLSKDGHLKSFARNVYRARDVDKMLCYLREHPNYAIDRGFRLRVVPLIRIEDCFLDKENGLVEKLKTSQREEIRISGELEYRGRLEDY